MLTIDGGGMAGASYENHDAGTTAVAELGYATRSPMPALPAACAAVQANGVAVLAGHRQADSDLPAAFFSRKLPSLQDTVRIVCTGCSSLVLSLGFECAHLEVVNLNGVLANQQRNCSGNVSIEAMLTCDQPAVADEYPQGLEQRSDVLHEG